MPPPSTPLHSLLPFISDQSLSALLRFEVLSLSRVIGEISSEIYKRRELEADILRGLEYDQLYLSSKRADLNPYQCRGDLERLIALDQNILTIEREKIHVREAATRDTFEMKKMLLNNWLEVSRKAAAFRFVE